MKVLDIIQTANSNLFRSKLRTFLTVLAVFVGAFTLTLTTGLGSGIKDYIDKQTNAVSLKDTVTILPGAFSNFSAITGEAPEYNPNEKATVSSTFLTQSDIEAVKTVDKVTTATLLYAPKPEYVTREGQKKYKDDLLDVFVPNLVVPMAAGKLPNPDNQNEMILAYKYLKPLGFDKPDDALGKQVEYVFRNQSGDEFKRTLTITGVQINSIVGSQNRINYKLSEEAFLFQFGTTDASQAAFAYLEPNLSDDELEQVKADLKAKGYGAQTFDDQIKQITGTIALLQTVVSVFGIVVILAAAIGIINTLLMAVYERTREVGLMKALGMRRGGIFAMFAFEAASIGFWGGLFGVLLAVLTGTFLNSYATQSFLKDFEGFTLFAFPISSLLPVIIGTMIVGLIAGTLPALKAAKLNPIEALRYE
jgi:putative ABC transport system permease protein